MNNHLPPSSPAGDMLAMIEAFKDSGKAKAALEQMAGVQKQVQAGLQETADKMDAIVKERAAMEKEKLALEETKKQVEAEKAFILGIKNEIGGRENTSKQKENELFAAQKEFEAFSAKQKSEIDAASEQSKKLLADAELIHAEASKLKAEYDRKVSKLKDIIGG